jgi:hypothetical protein
LALANAYAALMPEKISRHGKPLRRVTGQAAVFILTAALCVPAEAGVTVKPSAKGYDIDVDGPTKASELIDAIASATGVNVKGQPEETTIGPNHLHGTSLERALRMLLPKVPFAVRFDADDIPEAIIFLSPAQDGPASDGSDGANSIDSGDVSTPVDAPDTPDDGAPDSGG